MYIIKFGRYSREMSATKKVSSTVQQDRRDYYAKLVVLAFGFITVLFIARQLFDDEFSLVVKWWLVFKSNQLFTLENYFFIKWWLINWFSVFIFNDF